MDKKINDLFQKCIKEGITFYYEPEVYSIRLYVIKEGEHIFQADGYIKNWNHEKPIDVLNRLHDSVDEYLEGVKNNE